MSRMPVDAGDRVLAEHVRAERVRFVFIQSALPIIFSPLAAGILTATLWNTVDRRLMLGWTIGLGILAVIRALLVRAFKHVDATVDSVRRWERYFVSSIVLVDLWWGVGAVLLLPMGLTERAVIFSFVMLMAGGHTASYSAHPVTVVIGVLALTMPITVAFAIRADAFHLALAFVAIMYLAASFRSIKTLSYFFGRSYQLAHELRAEKQRVEELARTDFLTALLNRRAFYAAGEELLQAASRSGRSVAVLMLDIDHFKAVNDQYGHAGGDAVIRAVADLMREQAREKDAVGRLGGEEFAVILPETTLDEAKVQAEQMREAAQALSVPHEGASIHFTVSIGVAVLAVENVDALLDRADRALYDAKRSGRNRVTCAVAAA
jgi:diguanylate cyclase (GGDEF)-like protein